MRLLLQFTTAASIALVLGACSTSGTELNTGERISQRGGEIGSYGDAWSDGRKAVEQGQKLIKKSSSNLEDAERDLERARERAVRAERQISQARADRAKGQQFIQDGNGQMQRAEADYSAVRSGPSAANPND